MAIKGLNIGLPVCIDKLKCSSLRALKDLQVDPTYRALQREH